jgi:dolichol-phosphate mannosyltransferase
MLKFAIDGLTSFSYIPLKLAAYLGFTTAFLSIIGIIYALYRKIFHTEEVISGWTFTIICIFFIGSIQLIVLAIIGEYIGRIYTETQQRPLYIVREKINFEEKQGDSAQ